MAQGSELFSSSDGDLAAGETAAFAAESLTNSSGLAYGVATMTFETL